jgi:preprotein translocase subunit YajC
MQFTSSLPFLAQAPQQNGTGPMVLMVLMFVVMYFLIIRPQRRQQKEHQERISKLRSGDKVITAGGIHGTITNVKAKSVVVKIADNVRVEVEKASVSVVLQKADEPEATEVVDAGSTASTDKS